jgi:hypothetical protein
VELINADGIGVDRYVLKLAFTTTNTCQLRPSH